MRLIPLLFACYACYACSACALDLGKLLTPANVNLALDIAKSVNESRADGRERCTQLLDPASRQREMQQRLMLLTTAQDGAAIVTTAASIQAAMMYHLLLDEANQCYVRTQDWEALCTSPAPQLAGQCSAELPLNAWIANDWICPDNSSACQDKRQQLQAIQRQSRLLGQWALESNARQPEPVTPQLLRSTLGMP